MRVYDTLFQGECCGTVLGYYLKIMDMADKPLYRYMRYLWKRSEDLRIWAERSYAESPQPKDQEKCERFDLNYYRLMDLKGTDWMINTPLFDAVYREVRKRGIKAPEEITQAMAERKWAGIL